VGRAHAGEGIVHSCSCLVVEQNQVEHMGELVARKDLEARQILFWEKNPPGRISVPDHSSEPWFDVLVDHRISALCRRELRHGTVMFAPGHDDDLQGWEIQIN